VLEDASMGLRERRGRGGRARSFGYLCRRRLVLVDFGEASSRRRRGAGRRNMLCQTSSLDSVELDKGRETTRKVVNLDQWVWLIVKGIFICFLCFL
jgi:hypothetical protein